MFNLEDFKALPEHEQQQLLQADPDFLGALGMAELIGEFVEWVKSVFEKHVAGPNT